MSNEKFRVKFGLQVGDTTADIDASTGDITTIGDINVNGGDVKTTATLASVFNTTATTVSLGGAATTVSIGANTGTTTINNSLVADELTVSGDLAVNGGDITTSATSATVFNATASTLGIGGAATTVSIGADTGTTTVNNALAADSLTTTGDVAVNGGDITTSAASATVFNATATTLGLGGAATTVGIGAATGTLTLNNATVVGNAANTTQNLYNTVATTMNFAGAATTTNIGANTGSSIINGVNRYTSPIIYNFAGANNYRGLMISNGNTGSTPNARTGLVLRTFPTATQPRGGLIFENARGTETSPTALQGPSTTAVPDFLGEISAGGRSSTGWINDLVAASPLGFTSYAAENWVAATNCGVGWALQLQPSATTLTAGGASRITTIDSTPQGLQLRGDTHGFSKGKTIQFTATGCTTSGTTLTIGTLSSGTVAVGSMIQNSTSLLPAGTYIIANISGSGSGSTWTLNQAPGNYTPITVQGWQGYVAYTGTGDVDVIGDLTIRGNDIKGSTGTSQVITSAAGATLELRGNNIQLENAAGSALTSADISYTRTYGEVAYTNAAGFAIAAQNTIYTMPLDTTLNASGVTISGTGQVNINVAGWYKIIMSLQATLTVSNQPGQFDFWLRKNGSDVANSKTQVDLLKDQKAVISMDWLVNSDGNDYWEIVYVGTTTNYADIDFPTIAATTTPYVSPLAPALLVNVIPAGM